MDNEVREVEIGETGFTLLLVGLVAALALSFWLGTQLGMSQTVSVNRESVSTAVPIARSGDPQRTSSASGTTTSTPGTPVVDGRLPLAAGATASPVNGGADSVRPHLASASTVFFGPPPLPSPIPVGGIPGISQRGVRKAVALEVLAADDMDRALAERVRLLGKGYPAYVATVSEAAGTGRFRVRVGDYASSAEAEGVRQRLRDRENIASNIVN